VIADRARKLPGAHSSITVGAMSHDVEHRALSRYLDDHQLKHTKQREAILEIFLEVTGHITGEDLYQRVRELHPQIGYTTVYRTLKLLCEAGLAHEHNFDGTTRYEIAHQHHDHLVCIRCGKIIEFECEMIEKAQEQIAERYQFRVLRHRHELYGHCGKCQAEVARRSV
jgi:Fur family transcriptional regulator, ferric uptake regulator